ncbi:hypothetical protein GCM10012280_49410 [Wenjunlia tyrosinilytica]|uniref:Uncharacterized protein n=1 Tax=Wenjunlia tyrosinilytica TaxID=1544741 RepID=A0A917ZTM4_9ACTN|nr:hypothetical protein GCM10012280_49410 [Wenjunlia tyrosinilytica]
MLGRRTAVPASGGAASADMALRRVITELVTRVVGSHRRVERDARRQGVVHGRLGAAATPVGQQPPVVARLSAPPGYPPGAAAAARGGPDPAQADLERLTDRIVTRLDDRLTAQRERFGRVF